MNAFSLTATLPGFDLAAAAAWSSPDAALFGRSGSGKSTVLEAIAGLRREVRGSIEIGGRRIDALPARARRIGWVSQDGALMPHKTVRENLDFAVAVRGNAEAARRAIEALEIGDLLSRRAAVLSGGERQRVAIARALASAPEFLLLDEPLAAIDRPLRERIVPFLERLRRDLAVPYLLVTHDPLEVVALASHVLVIEAGRIVATGDPRAVFAAAGSFGVLHAMGAENRVAVSMLSRATATARVRTARGVELELALPPGFPAPKEVAIRAEDILVAIEEPRGLSAQNVLPGEIVAIDAPPALGGACVVSLRISGETFQSRLTAGAVARLGLRVGAPAWIVMKAHSIHPL